LSKVATSYLTQTSQLRGFRLNLMSVTRPVFLALSFFWRKPQIRQESRAIARRTARCHCKFRYVLNCTVPRYRAVFTAFKLNNSINHGKIMVLSTSTYCFKNFTTLSAKCRPMILVSRNISFMRIFAGVPRGEGVKYNVLCLRPNFEHVHVFITYL